MTSGSALSPSYTAFDPATRAFFITTQRNSSAASLWGVTISPDTNTSKVLSTEVRYAYPEAELPLVGLQVSNNPAFSVLTISNFLGLEQRCWPESPHVFQKLHSAAGNPTFFLLFAQTEPPSQVDFTTGAASRWGDLCGQGRVLTTAIELNQAANQL